MAFFLPLSIMVKRELLVVMLLLCSCTRAKTPAAPPFDARRFITLSLLTSKADADLGALAAKKGRLPETRQFGDAMHRDQSAMASSLAELARRRNIGMPAGLEEKKVALKDNLTILPGQVFDRGYALAMVQDLDNAIASFNAASSATDRDVQQFAQQYRATLIARKKDADALLSRLGGSPF